VLAAIVYMVQAGCSWRKLPAAMFGTSRATVHRCFSECTTAGLWERLHAAFVGRLNVVSEVDWSRAVVDSIAVRAERTQARVQQRTRSTVNHARVRCQRSSADDRPAGRATLHVGVRQQIPARRGSAMGRYHDERSRRQDNG
jgi:transposase